MRNGRMLLLILLIVTLSACGKKPDTPPENEWNNGYCIECGGGLNYKCTGGKEHYKCEICGKEYIFDRLQVRKHEDRR